MAALKLLVIDDEPALLRLLEFLLGHKGYQVTGVSDGQQALDYLATETPALIICDVMMPVFDGFDVLSVIRSSEHMSSIPVVLLTARAQLADIQKGLNMGADAYLVKPFDPEDLLSVVQSLIGGS